MNWQKFVQSLLESGLTQVQIASAVGCKQPTVSDWATGAAQEPRGTFAIALLALGRERGLSATARTEAQETTA